MSHIFAAIAIASFGLMLYLSSILLALLIIAFLPRKQDKTVNKLEDYNFTYWLVTNGYISANDARRACGFTEPASESREDRGR